MFLFDYFGNICIREGEFGLKTGYGSSEMVNRSKMTPVRLFFKRKKLKSVLI